MMLLEVEEHDQVTYFLKIFDVLHYLELEIINYREICSLNLRIKEFNYLETVF